MAEKQVSRRKNIVLGNVRVYDYALREMVEREFRLKNDAPTDKQLKAMCEKANCAFIQLVSTREENYFEVVKTPVFIECAEMIKPEERNKFAVTSTKDVALVIVRLYDKNNHELIFVQSKLEGKTPEELRKNGAELYEGNPNYMYLDIDENTIEYYPEQTLGITESKWQIIARRTDKRGNVEK